jgi:glutathione synthase/RimK-type ligase-like ATP-grasp enzyme
MSADQVLIVTNQDDPHADCVIRALLTIGIEPVRLNTDEVPLDTVFGLRFEGAWNGRIELAASNRIVDVERIRSVWWRRPRAYRLPEGLSPLERDFAADELDHALRGLWSALDCYWMSHPDAITRAGWKLGQLQRAARLGFAVPRTLVTTDPAQVLAFHEACREQVVYKVMTGPYMAADRFAERHPDAPLPEAVQTHTTAVGAAELEHLEHIRVVPCLFQERVPKRCELRVTVVGGEVFVAEIDSQAHEHGRVDWRDVHAEDLAVCAGQIPAAVADACCALVRGYGLTFSAIDLIVTPDDRYVFLESNPNGQFRFVEELVPELEITDAIAAALAHADGS